MKRNQNSPSPHTTLERIATVKPIVASAAFDLPSVSPTKAGEGSIESRPLPRISLVAVPGFDLRAVEGQYMPEFLSHDKEVEDGLKRARRAILSHSLYATWRRMI